MSIIKFVLIILAICLSISNMHDSYSTNKTTTTSKYVFLKDIVFPLKFSILITPGFNETSLDEVGYNSTLSYFLGRSKYAPEKHFGWAGHTPQGTTVGNVSGQLFLYLQTYSCSGSTSHFQIFLKGILNVENNKFFISPCLQGLSYTGEGGQTTSPQ